MIKGLEALENCRHEIGHLSIEGDSQVVIRHMNGMYNVNSEQLYPLWSRADKLVSSLGYNGYFQSHSYEHIYREENTNADRLANESVDHGSSSSWDYY